MIRAWGIWIKSVGRFMVMGDMLQSAPSGSPAMMAWFKKEDADSALEDIAEDICWSSSDLVVMPLEQSL